MMLRNNRKNLVSGDKSYSPYTSESNENSNATFKEFVQDMNMMNSNGKSFEGFCIEGFHKVLEPFRRIKFEK